MLPSLLAAGLAGLVGSPHCAAMCGGFAVSCGTSAGRTAAWHAGRLTTYGSLGALAGAFGGILPVGSGAVALASALLIVLFAGMLGGWIPEPQIRGRRLVRLSGVARAGGGLGGSWLFGLLNGFLPCGLVWAALAIPIGTGSALAGALTMVAFGLGTTPLLSALTLGVRGLVLRDLRLRRLVAAGVLVSGLLSIGLRQGLAPEDAANHSPPSSDDAPVAVAGTDSRNR